MARTITTTPITQNEALDGPRAVMYLWTGWPELQGARLIPYQRDLCWAIAKERGLALVREYADVGQSARPVGLLKLVDELERQRDAEVVLIGDLTPLRRDQRHLLSMVRRIRECGATIITASGFEDDLSNSIHMTITGIQAG